jgi:hypothetical protein
MTEAFDVGRVTIALVLERAITEEVPSNGANTATLILPRRAVGRQPAREMGAFWAEIQRNNADPVVVLR